MEFKKVVLYTIGCPKCKILEKKLEAKNIKYEIFTNEEEMLRQGITHLPMLKLDDELLDFGKAVKWINNYEQGEDE